MQKRYRSWAERRAIIAAIIAEESPPRLDAFGLTESEELYFRPKSKKAVEKTARQTSSFKSYYSLPTAKPFRLIVIITVLILVFAGCASLYVRARIQDASAFPLYGSLTALSAAALGWTVAGWIGHRNTIRQNTNNLLFARFSHAPFGEALHRFHNQFGVENYPLVTPEIISELRAGSCEDGHKAAASVSYILNYYEFIASGVLHGDFDKRIVEDNIRGLIIFYHDKCAPYVYENVPNNSKVFYNLKKIRTHYREP